MRKISDKIKRAITKTAGVATFEIKLKCNEDAYGPDENMIESAIMQGCKKNGIKVRNIDIKQR